MDLVHGEAFQDAFDRYCERGCSLRAAHQVCTEAARKIIENNPATRHYSGMEWKHLSDHDLERYYLGMVKDETELAALEEHILACGSCAERAVEAQDYVDAIRDGGLDFIDPYEGRH